MFSRIEYSICLNGVNFINYSISINFINEWAGLQLSPGVLAHLQGIGPFLERQRQLCPDICGIAVVY